MSKIRHAVTLMGVAALAMTAPILLSVSAASATSRHMAIDGYTCTVVSTKAGATVHGSPNAVVCGLGANSTISAGNGYEVLIAGAGRDTLIASSSPSSRDILIGGSGRDTLIGGAGTDTLIGGTGANTLRAGTGTQFLYAGTHTNHLYGGSGTNTLAGGAGTDVLHAGTGPTTLFGGTGNQQLVGGTGHDNFIGGTGRTLIHASRGTHDIFLAATKKTHLDCGSTNSGVIVASGASQSADCSGHGNDHAGYQAYAGVISATTGSQISLTYSETNDAAKTWLAANGSPQPATFDLTGATVNSDTGSIVPAVNDCAAVFATAPASGTVLPAVFVELHTCESSDIGQQRYRGTVTGVSGSQITVTYTEANDTAQTWLAANGNPNPVTFDISAATVESHTGSTTPAINDCVSVSATTPSSGLLLPAVRVSIHHCEGEDSGLQGYRGTITGVSGSQITLAYTDANDTAQAWLNANANPTSVTFDLTSATVESHTGSTTPAINDCAEVSATTPSSGLILPAVTVELHPCNGDGGGDGGGGGGGGEHSNMQRYRGTVSGVSGSQIQVTYTDANGTAQTWLAANGNPNPVTFDISAATVESTTGSTTPAVNDCVGITATTPSSGTILPAVQVVLHACDLPDSSYQLYGGTVTSVSGSQMVLTYTFTNGAAQTWLAANGNPQPVTFDLTSATIHSHTASSTPTPGDCAGVAATAPSSGTVLPAVAVELFPCGSKGGGD